MSYYNQGQPPYGQPQQGYAPPPLPPGGQQQGYYAPPPGPPGQAYGAPPGPPPGSGQAYGAPPGPPPGSGQAYGAPPGPPPGPAPGYYNGPTPAGYPAQGAYNTGPAPGGYAPQGPPQHTGYGPPGGPPPTGYASPPDQRNYGPPGGAPAGYNPSYPQSGPPQHAQAQHPQYSQHGAQQPQFGHQSDPLLYLGAPIPDPSQPANAVNLPGFDASQVVEKVRKATKGFGTDEAALIKALAPLSSLQMAAVSQKFSGTFGKGLTSELTGEVGGYFKEGLRAITLGPIGYDVYLLDEALEGAGTKEQLLTELIMGRSNSDLRHLSNAYNRVKGKDSLVGKITGDLTAKTERAFVMALGATRVPDNVPVDHNQVVQDVERLYKAGQGKMGTDELVFCEILTNRSYPHITAITEAYPKKHKKTLSKVIKSEFSSHLRDALLHIVVTCNFKRISFGLGVWRDMKLIENAMKGMGTKDFQLVYRISRAHWDHQRMSSIRSAYRSKYKNKELHSRVDGETGGDYSKLMVQLVKGDEHRVDAFH